MDGIELKKNQTDAEVSVFIKHTVRVRMWHTWQRLDSSVSSRHVTFRLVSCRWSVDAVAATDFDGLVLF